MSHKQEYPFIAYQTNHGELEIVACSNQRYRLIHGGRFVAAFTNMVSAMRYLNREFICLISS